MLDIALALCTNLYIYDGDNLRATCQGQRQTFRLATINAPEIAGKCHAERNLARLARDKLRTIASHPGAQLIEVLCHGSNFGRKCAIIKADGKNLLDELVPLYADSYTCTARGCPTRRNWCQ